MSEEYEAEILGNKCVVTPACDFDPTLELSDKSIQIANRIIKESESIEYQAWYDGMAAQDTRVESDSLIMRMALIIDEELKDTRPEHKPSMIPGCKCDEEYTNG